jgi:CelD/BcsL family acetyltransferase involved in cellulose biosynthesis
MTCRGVTYSLLSLPEWFNASTKLVSPESSTSTLNVQLLSTSADWGHLKSRWQELLENSRSDALFLSWDWLDTWLSIYGSGGEWVILLVENEAKQILGVAPMMIDQGSGTPGRWIRRLLLIGQKADTASEYLDWVLRSGYEEQVAAVICDYIFTDLASRWDILLFGSMREDSVTIPLIAKAFAKRGIQISKHRVTAAPYVSLPSTWDEFLSRRSSTFRQRWKKFHREHAVVLRVVGKDFSVSEGMETLRRLNALRWGDERRSFLSPNYVRFHDEVAARFYQRKQLLMLFLEVDGEVVAGRYDFDYAGKGWCFQGGWLPECEKLRPGRTMMAYQMQCCIERGLLEYDFLGGDASYKGEWSQAERWIIDLGARNPSSLRGWLFEKAKALKVALRARK